MPTRRVCVFNQTRQSFLSLDTTVADTQLSRLKGLLGKRELKSNEGLWLVPCQGIHTIGLLFPIDVIYLDAEYRVVHVIEHLKPFRITSLRRNCHSVLEVPLRTIFESETEVGDQITFSDVFEAEERAGVTQKAEPELEASERGIMARLTPLPAADPLSPGEAHDTGRQIALQSQTGSRWQRSEYLYSTEPGGPFCAWARMWPTRFSAA
jgi:uncharacterized membrane protein (UPF0127 family)